MVNIKQLNFLLNIYISLNSMSIQQLHVYYKKNKANQLIIIIDL
jgi:hypothetical protein